MMGICSFFGFFLDFKVIMKNMKINISLADESRIFFDVQFYSLTTKSEYLNKNNHCLRRIFYRLYQLDD